MNDTQKIGGIAALIEATTFVVGIAMFATVLSDYAVEDPDPGESVAFLIDNQATLYIWYLITLIVFGVALVVLSLVLYERLRAGSPALARIATAFGLIWAGLVIAAGMIAGIGVGTVADLVDDDPAQAESVWSALDSVQNGLGGGNEIIGGIWVLLVSWAALRSGALPRPLNYLGVVGGVAGLVTIVPALEAVGLIFGLGLIVWFVWVGIVLLGGSREDDRQVDTAGTTRAPTVP
jgi:uncharacterized membrane protein